MLMSCLQQKKALDHQSALKSQQQSLLLCLIGLIGRSLKCARRTNNNLLVWFSLSSRLSCLQSIASLYISSFYFFSKIHKVVCKYSYLPPTQIYHVPTKSNLPFFSFYSTLHNSLSPSGRPSGPPFQFDLELPLY